MRSKNIIDTRAPLQLPLNKCSGYCSSSTYWLSQLDYKPSQPSAVTIGSRKQLFYPTLLIGQSIDTQQGIYVEEATCLTPGVSKFRFA